MRINRHFATIVAILVALSSFLSSCKKDEEQPVASSEPCYISVVFPTKGVGDRGFNDNVYEGIFRVKEFYKGPAPLSIRIVIPDNHLKAVEYMKHWFETNTSDRRLLVVVGDVYKLDFQDHPNWRPSKNSDVLLLDFGDAPDGFYLRSIPLYGLSYLAGLVLPHFYKGDIVTISANPVDAPLKESIDGLMDGYSLAVNDTSFHFFHTYIAEEAGEGYDKPDEVFAMCLQQREENHGGDFHEGFIFPVCGSSAQGVYRFLRTYFNDGHDGDGMFLTCGLDVSQSEYSIYVVFSLIKNYNYLLERFIYDWVDKKKMPYKERLGVGTEYADLIFGDLYFDLDRVSTEQMHNYEMQAAEAERLYYQNLDNSSAQ